MEEVVAFEDELEQKDKLWSSKSPYSRKLVPWLSWDEWLFVYDSLFSDSSQSVAAALTRISTWQSRGCLPIAIEVTALIIDIQQSDPHLRNDQANDPSNKNPAKQCTNLSISEEKLAMLYSMVIMRLVNGLIEKTRDKKKSSIAAAAREIGMPRKLIDIRHEVSHREIPALQIVRDASAEALDWLKFFYWEPQKKAVPFHGREEIKSKLHELTLCLKAKQSCPSVSSPLKAKCSRNHKLLCGRNKFLSIAAGKLHSSKSGGDKKQTKKVLKNLLGMYSSCSSEVVSVLLEFLLIALNSLDLVELPADSQVGTSLDSLLNQWKLVIKRLSHKEPELLVSLLEEVLHTIETQETMKYENGNQHLISSEKSPEVFRVERLSSLFTWLVTNLKDFMPKLHKDSDAEKKVPTAETSLSKAILVQLLQKCLTLSASGNKQLMISAIHIAQLIGDNHLMGKMNKLSVLVSSNSDILEDDSSINLKNLLLQQDESISQAAKKLELLKHRRMKSKVTNSTDIVMGKSNRWVVATSWNRCPLGMLPSFFGSSGRLPVLDCEDDQNKIPETSRAKENRESNRNCKRIEADSNVQQVDNSSAKKRKVTVEEDYKANSEGIGSVIGHLMINGAWKKVGEEELLAIKSSIRILV